MALGGALEQTFCSMDKPMTSSKSPVSSLLFKYAVPFRFYTVRREGETWGRGGARDINAIRIYTRTHIQNPCLLLGFIYSAGTIDMDLLKWFDAVSL